VAFLRSILGARELGPVLAYMSILESLKATRRPLTTKQAAEMLGLHPMTVYKWSRTGRIPTLRLGGALRFDPQALAAWLEARSV
jgi:excisionase family DNA binding protein